ncbi:HNH endonuclease signature motif containing protein [Novosphingobium sp. Leaf2]|uniref:HNH endonuclease signature motif containing protein n=1 Tax=Novosphingobium sp. Leaf2 TaxID=1735670 RepID=UPI0009EB9763|nr:HNH endonuclease signature motif containing protein [Novosphingobium sp. Leaf2]
MTKAQLPSIEYLRQRLSYNPVTGDMVWREAYPSDFKQDWVCRDWNRRWAGGKAGSDNGRGYLVLGIAGFNLRVHRVAWAMYTGSWPEHSIDHINGNKNDNRISNLRDVPHEMNTRNSPISRRNTTGRVGVQQLRDAWRVEIGSGTNKIYLGKFTTFADAVTARRTAEEKLGYHPNHGRKS